MFIIEVPHLDLDKIYLTNQTSRWIRVEDGKYIIPFTDKAVRIEQKKDKLVMSCTDEQFYDYWYEYFDMQTDYADISFKTKKINNFMKICGVRSKGVRVLKQDFTEVVISSMLATDVNDHRAKFMLDYFCLACGKKHKQSMKESGEITWYEFPLSDRILKYENRLDATQLNGRKDDIIKFANDIEEGWFDIDILNQLSLEEAIAFFKQFDYLDKNIIENICLYTLHLLNTIPDNHLVNEAFDREFETDDDDEIRDGYFQSIQGYEGAAFLLILFNETKDPEEEEIWD